MFYQIKLSGVIKFMCNSRGVGLLILFLVVSSCSPALKFSSVKYDAESINKLLDPSSPMKSLTLIYNSDDGKSYKNAFNLVSYARDAKGGYLNVPAYNLTSAEGKKSNTFKGKTIIANLTLDRDSILSLLKDAKTGEIDKNFKYLLFTPVRDKEYNYMYYAIKVVTGDSSSAGSRESLKVSANPCPPAKGCRPTN